jgi:hypothetical protein
MWNPLQEPNYPFMLNLSQCIKEFADVNPDRFPEIKGDVLLITSDYSGSQKQSDFDVISILLSDFDNLGAWHTLRQSVRDEHLRDGRRMSYKGLGDKYRQRALHPFLNAANVIPGLLFSVAISKKIRPLVMKPGELDELVEHYQLKGNWDDRSLENMLRVANFVSFAAAGIFQNQEGVLWLTDHDELAANPLRISDVCNVLPFFELLHFRKRIGFRFFQTITAPEFMADKLLFEDLCAIPDLAAGMLSEQFTYVFRKQVLSPSSKDQLIKASTEVIKSNEIGKWYSENGHVLKRLCCTFTPVDEPGYVFQVLLHAFADV